MRGQSSRSAVVHTRSADDDFDAAVHLDRGNGGRGPVGPVTDQLVAQIVAVHVPQTAVADHGPVAEHRGRKPATPDGRGRTVAAATTVTAAAAAVHVVLATARAQASAAAASCRPIADAGRTGHRAF